MTDLCPPDGRHNGWAGVRITTAGVKPRPPFITFRRFMLCSHPDHPDNFLHCWPGNDNHTGERGWGWIWIRALLPNGRRWSSPVRMVYLCDACIQRIYDAMVWVS